MGGLLEPPDMRECHLTMEIGPENHHFAAVSASRALSCRKSRLSCRRTGPSQLLAVVPDACVLSMFQPVPQSAVISGSVCTPPCLPCTKCHRAQCKVCCCPMFERGDLPQSYAPQSCPRVPRCPGLSWAIVGTTRTGTRTSILAFNLAHSPRR